jgi:subtilisin family serine protease
VLRRARALAAALLTCSALFSASTMPAAAAGVPSAARAATSPTGGLTGRVLVSLRAPAHGRAHASAVVALAAAGARPDGPSAPQIGMVTVVPPRGVSPAALVRRVLRLSTVRAASLERRFAPREIPNDPTMSAPETAPGTPPGTPIEWWALRENLPHMWDLTHGDGAVVGVVDSGIDATQPEFAGRIDRTNDLASTSGDGPADTDQFGHGTHVAGLACAAAGNAAGLAGSGYACHLIVEKTDFSEGSVIQAITDATDHGALAINMSFGTDGSQPAPPALYDAVSYAYARKVVLVSAASDSPVTQQGDPSNVLQPNGTGPDISQGRGLSVTAANFNDQRASFAGLGTEISLAAYGSFYDSSSQGGPAGLLSTFPANHVGLEDPAIDLTNPGSPLIPPCGCRTTLNGDDRYAYLAGTSMASPQVAAVAALVRRLNPDLGAGDVIRLLKQTARRAPAAGWSQDLGWGILDAGAAIDAARTIDRRAPVSRLTAPHTTRHTVVTLAWTGSDPAPAGLVASGIDHWEVYRQIGSAPPVRIASLPAAQTSLRVRVAAGRLYGWYVVAVDRAGNREAKHAAEARTRVSRSRRSSAARRPRHAVQRRRARSPA